MYERIEVFGASRPCPDFAFWLPKVVPFNLSTITYQSDEKLMLRFSTQSLVRTKTLHNQTSEADEILAQQFKEIREKDGTLLATSDQEYIKLTNTHVKWASGSIIGIIATIIGAIKAYTRLFNTNEQTRRNGDSAAETHNETIKVYIAPNNQVERAATAVADKSRSITNNVPNDNSPTARDHSSGRAREAASTRRAPSHRPPPLPPRN